MMDRSASRPVKSAPAQVKLSLRQSEVKYCGAIAGACSHDDEIKACDNTPTSSPLCLSPSPPIYQPVAPLLQTRLATSPPRTHLSFSRKHQKVSASCIQATPDLYTAYLYTHSRAPTTLYIMSTKVSKTVSFKFRLATGLNQKKEEVDTIITIYLKSNRLRQGIYQSDLIGGRYELFVGELQINWGGAVSAIKTKATLDVADKNDNSQIGLIAGQIRKIVEKYLSTHPNAIKHTGIRALHISVLSAIVAEAVYEIQTESKRIFAKYLLDHSLKKVTVDGVYSRLRDEPEEAFQIRTLKSELDKRVATIEKLTTENRDLKSQLEDKNDLRLQLESARSAEQAVRQNAEEKVGKFVNTNVWLRGQLAQAHKDYEALKGHLKEAKDEMRGLHRKAADFEGKVMRLEREAAAAEKEVEELKQQLKDE